MNTRYNLNVIGGAILLTVLFCAGIFFYARWDHQRFVERLPQAPKFDVPSEPVKQREFATTEIPAQTPPSATVDFKGLEGHHIEPEVPDMERAEVQLEETDLPFEETTLPSPNSEVVPSLSTVELPKALEETPVEAVDFRETRDAWQEYNNFLTTDPDYAYAQLAEGFQKMYGDHPEIDIIVENIKRANEGALTVDDAIALMTANLKIMPADQTFVIEQLSEQLEVLHELKAFESEDGKAMVTFNISVGKE